MLPAAVLELWREFSFLTLPTVLRQRVCQALGRGGDPGSQERTRQKWSMADASKVTCVLKCQPGEASLAFFRVNNSHHALLTRLSRVAEETIKDYFESRLALLEPVFPIACHRLCEGPDFSMDFNYKPPQNIPEGKPVSDTKTLFFFFFSIIIMYNH